MLFLAGSKLSPHPLARRKMGAKLDSSKVVIVIPARYGSTRLPGKPLISLAVKPMIQRVYERAKDAQTAGRAIVGTDDERIVEAVAGDAREARMIRAEPPTGTVPVA